MIRVVRISLIAAALALCAPLATSAQPPDGPESLEFQAVEGPQTEDVPGGPLLVGAYAIFVVALLLYVVRIASMQSRTARDLDRLERSLAAAQRRESDDADERDASEGD